MFLDPYFLHLLPVKATLGIVVGLVLGSFTTMLSHRLPRKENFINERSACPQCKTELSARDLVPVFSWLFMKGKCRHCGKKISVRYPLIELTVAALSTAAFIKLGFGIALLVTLIAIVGVVTAIIIRLER